MISPSVTTQVKKWSYQTHSLISVPRPGPDLPLDIAIHHAHITPDHKEAFQQAFVNDPEMRALTDLIITGWPKDIKEVPRLLCQYWQHQETLTIEDVSSPVR